MVYLYPLFAGSILATVLQLPRSQQHSWRYYLRTRKIRYKMKRGRELSWIYSQQIGQNGRRRKALTFPLSLIPIPAPLPQYDLFQFSMTLSSAVIFENFQHFTCFSIFFYLKQFNRNKLWYPPKCVPFALFNYPSLSYVIRALLSAVTNLPNKTLIFHDFQGPTIKFHNFPSLKNEIFKFHDSYELCGTDKI